MQGHHKIAVNGTGIEVIAFIELEIDIGYPMGTVKMCWKIERTGFPFFLFIGI